MSTNGTEKQQPLAEAKEGNILAQVWENEGKHGKWHSITVNRVYKADDGWGYAKNFSVRDRENLSKALGRAFEHAEKLEAAQEAKRGIEQKHERRNTLSI
jgi:hypothetical protein